MNINKNIIFFLAFFLSFILNCQRSKEPLTLIKPVPYIEIEIRKELKNKIFVPPIAISEDKANFYLFTLKKKQNGYAIAHKQIVEIGELNDYGIEITKGLNEGDFVAIKFADKLKNGKKVKLKAHTGENP
ncbi:MAG: hypothetical protein HQK76_05930 [Desulfobacterales bacterium]|nr:hypothetical protein [Desulfobacterales bacterium]